MAADTTPETTDAAPKKRGGGRPKGSKNKKTIEREQREAAERAAAIARGEEPPQKRGPGRPKGSKNKKTIERERAAAKTAKKTGRAKKPAPKKTEYEKAMEQMAPQWLSYPGNKRQLLPIIYSLMPAGGVDRFVDMFGGTGITGVNAYKTGMCDSVIYNDLEYDMTLLLEWLYVTPLDEIGATYQATKQRWFGDDERLRLTEDARHKRIWDMLVNHYNNTRIILWDRDDDAELERLIMAVEDKDVRRQLEAYAGGRKRMKSEVRASTDQKQQWRNMERKSRAHKTTEQEDMFAMRGDFFNAGELLFIFLNNYRGAVKWKDWGREADATPDISTEPRGTRIASINKVLAFAEELQKTPMEFYSQSFTEGWIDVPNLRGRSGVALAAWRRMLSTLTPYDLVFLDPPYHGSKTDYTGGYSIGMELYLFAFAQLLTERGIPWIMTNNIHYDNPILQARLKDFYVHQLKPGIRLYGRGGLGSTEANEEEVFITNYARSDVKLVKEMTKKLPRKDTRGACIPAKEMKNQAARKAWRALSRHEKMVARGEVQGTAEEIEKMKKYL